MRCLFRCSMKESAQLHTAAAFYSRVKNMAPNMNPCKLSRCHFYCLPQHQKTKQEHKFSISQLLSFTFKYQLLLHVSAHGARYESLYAQSLPFLLPALTLEDKRRTQIQHFTTLVFYFQISTFTTRFGRNSGRHQIINRKVQNKYCTNKSQDLK